jgi:hypothetical protein
VSIGTCVGALAFNATLRRHPEGLLVVALGVLIGSYLADTLRKHWY